MYAKKVIGWTMIIGLLFTYTGCHSKVNNKENLSSGFSGYPMKTDETLTFWLDLNKNVSAISTELGKTPFAKEIERQTGVSVSYIHPIQGKADSQLSTLMASGDMPDIIEYDWNGLPGGSQKVLKDQYIIPLNDVIDKYSPNFKKVIQNDPEVDKLIKTSDGTYFYYPMIRETEEMTILTGPMVRADWLSELGLQKPETISDWYHMLKLFKEKKNAVSPLTFDSYIFGAGEFCGAYGVLSGFYVDDHKVQYGAISQNYKAFLKEFAKWYKEGLIDKNIGNIDSKSVDSNIIKGKSGATVSFAGSGMGKWNALLSANDPNAKLFSVKHAVLNRGDRPKFASKDMKVSTPQTTISASCKKVEIAARYLDFGYTEQGKRLYNFGIEGESYNMVDGYPKYTNLITNNPSGLTMNEAMGQYIRGNQQGPFVQAKEYLEQYYNTKEQKEALSVWAESDMDMHRINMVKFTLEESLELSGITSAINTYPSEMTIRFIMGVEPIENFETYVHTLKEMNIDRAIEIYQSAYNRYLQK